MRDTVPKTETTRTSEEHSRMGINPRGHTAHTIRTTDNNRREGATGIRREAHTEVEKEGPERDAQE